MITAPYDYVQYGFNRGFRVQTNQVDIDAWMANHPTAYFADLGDGAGWYSGSYNEAGQQLSVGYFDPQNPYPPDPAYRPYTAEELFAYQYPGRYENPNPYYYPQVRDKIRNLAVRINMSTDVADQTAMDLATEFYHAAGQYYTEATAPDIVVDNIVKRLLSRVGIVYPGMSPEQRAAADAAAGDLQNRLKASDHVGYFGLGSDFTALANIVLMAVSAGATSAAQAAAEQAAELAAEQAAEQMAAQQAAEQAVAQTAAQTAAESAVQSVGTDVFTDAFTVEAAQAAEAVTVVDPFAFDAATLTDASTATLDPLATAVDQATSMSDIPTDVSTPDFAPPEVSPLSVPNIPGLDSVWKKLLTTIITKAIVPHSTQPQKTQVPASLLTSLRPTAVAPIPLFSNDSGSVSGMLAGIALVAFLRSRK